jgi:Biotin-lipoyl like
MDNDEHDSSRIHFIGRIIGIAIVIGAVAASVYAFRLNFVRPRTDDAAIRANIVGIAPQVSGPIVELHVVDNQPVKQGDLLFAIDCRPYEARLARASRSSRSSTLGPRSPAAGPSPRCQDDLAQQIDLGQVDDFITPTADHGLEHEEAEAGHLLQADGRGHGEFLPRYVHLHQRGAVMLERLRDHRANLLWRARAQPQESSRLGHLGEVRIAQVRAKIEDAGRLHLQLDEGVVPEDDYLHGKLKLLE